MQPYGGYPAYPNGNASPRSSGYWPANNAPIMPAVRGPYPPSRPALQRQQPARYDTGTYPVYPSANAQIRPPPTMYPVPAYGINPQLPQAPMDTYDPSVYPGGNRLVPVPPRGGQGHNASNNMMRNYSSNPAVFDQLNNKKAKVKISKVFHFKVNRPEDEEEYVDEEEMVQAPPPRPESPASTCSHCSQCSDCSCRSCRRSSRKSTHEDCPQCRAEAKAQRSSRRHRHH